MWTTLLSAFSSDDEDEHDPLETLAADEDDNGPRTPESKLLQAQTLNLIDDEIKKLPTRQREAFLMRYWEDMDVAETAAAMGCSEGSVKTHCSRATHALAAALSAKGIRL
jgi:RNA polymerase sigma-70 factor (ECF subfamily)